MTTTSEVEPELVKEMFDFIYSESELFIEKFCGKYGEKIGAYQFLNAYLVNAMELMCDSVISRKKGIELIQLALEEVKNS